jgi:glycosyltransferase involved in cell wall biosynthesis
MLQNPETLSMKILFATNNGYLPEFSGGVQSSTDYLVRESRKLGHESSVFSALFGSGLFGLAARVKLKLGHSPVTRDLKLGYPVFRAWDPAATVAEVIRQARPDIAVTQCHGSVELAAAFRRHGVPAVVYFRNVEFDELKGNPAELEGCKFIANSQFTHDRYLEAFGIESTVIPPLIDAGLYAVSSTQRFVTFINPVEKKGLAKAIEIARALPDIPFLFVEGWSLSPDQYADLSARLRGLTNVTFRRRTYDMREVYGVTKILLVPSLWEEAWGRVASEAHCSGIPVVGSARGGLPEAIGPGGVILSHEAPAADWAAAIEQLWLDETLYRMKSEAARTYAAREPLNGSHQMQAFLSVLESASTPQALAPA